MIFVTVGTQLPFDRLVAGVDAWAGETGCSDVFAQIGPTAYVPRHLEFAQFISPAECVERMQDADAIVAHAGMGTILHALELGKPLLVMPRLASLGEHRNEHQSATAGRFEALGNVAVATDPDTLARELGTLHALGGTEPISRYASPRLINALSSFIRA